MSEQISIARLLEQYGFSSPMSYRTFVPIEFSARTDLSVDTLEDLCQGLEKNYGIQAKKALVEMVADLAMNTPEFGAPVVLQAIHGLYSAEWNYHPGVKLYAENMQPASPRAITFLTDRHKAKERQWIYEGFLKNHSQDMKDDTGIQVQKFFFGF